MTLQLPQHQSSPQAQSAVQAGNAEQAPLLQNLQQLAATHTQGPSLTLGHFSGKLDNGQVLMSLFLKLKEDKLIGTYQAPSGKKYDVQGHVSGQQTVTVQTVAEGVHVEIAGMLSGDQFLGTLSNPKTNYLSSFALKASPVGSQQQNGQQASTQQVSGQPHQASQQQQDGQQSEADTRHDPDTSKIVTISAAEKKRIQQQRDWGAAIGSLDGVTAYYNDGDSEKNGVHEGSRHYAADGYDYGIRWQCVEYVRRYFHDVHGVKFTTRGDAFSYYDHSVQDGETNSTRNLKQYRNGGKTKPQHGDLVVMGANAFSAVGHVAIVASVTEDSFTVAQQNVSYHFLKTFSLKETGTGDNKHYTTGEDAKAFRILGWLRK